MQSGEPNPWQHPHVFGQDRRRPGESRTLIVIVLTATMMVVEVAAGLVFGSMALLADGLHMASHAAALGISAFAYIYSRRHAHDPRFSFGTGKVNALGGFAGAVLLLVFALVMAWESVERVAFPVAIAFNQAIFVAFLGLLVNGVSMWILGHHGGHHHGNAHDDYDRQHADGGGHGGVHGHRHDHHHDHALRSAYLHVLADALTSLLAIFALLTAKYFGLIWMDPLMGIVGAALIVRWSYGLLRDSGGVLLDRQAPAEVREHIRAAIGRDAGNLIGDLHVWAIGPKIYSAIVSIATRDPKPPEHYKRLIPPELGVVHVTIEVHCHSRAREADRRARLTG